MMKYHFKVWLFTILFTPFLATVILWFVSSAKLSDIVAVTPLWFFAVFFGAAFSLPALFLFRLLYKDLVDRHTQAWKKKAIFGSVGGLLVWVTFYFVDRDILTDKDLNTLIWPILYSVCVTIGSFLFGITNKNQSDLTFDDAHNSGLASVGHDE